MGDAEVRPACGHCLDGHCPSCDTNWRQQLADAEKALAEEREKRERAEAKTLAVQSKSADKTQRIAELERELAEEREEAAR